MPSSHRTAAAVRRDYTRLAERYERRWRTFNRVVRAWVLERWPADLAARARVLDIGCGTGALLGELAARYSQLELIGIDLTPALLVEARRRAPTAKLIEGDAEAPPLAEKSFDVVCSLNVLHHLSDPASHADVLARLSRPGGTVFLCTFAGGRTLAMRTVDWWQKWRNAGWRGALSPADLDRAVASEPLLEVCERDELRAGIWRLQILRLQSSTDPAGRARRR